MFGRLALLFASLSLSGCGVAYVSTKVLEGQVAGAEVHVEPITVETVAIANAVPYAPRPVPAAFLAGAGGGSGLRGAGAVPEPAFAPEERPKALETRLPPAPPETPYRIGVGDVLVLATKAPTTTVEELSGLLAAQNRRQGYTVQDDGAIAIPDVGRVDVSGMTLEEAETELFRKLVEAQIDPTFSLEIAEFNSKRVAVGGAVSNPTVVPVKLTPLYLDEALAAAGGVTASDIDYATVRLYRDGQLYQIPLSELYAKQSLKRVRLTSGDSIFVDAAYDLDKAESYFSEQIRLAEYRQNARVQALRELESEVSLQRAALDESRGTFMARSEIGGEERDFVYLAGEVTKQRRFALPYGHQATLADALYDEGGLATGTGNPGQIYVLRATEGSDQITAWHLNGRNAASIILATRFELRPSDVVFVAEQPITRWNRVVQQIVPSLFNAAATASR